MGSENEPKPIEEFHPKDQVIAKLIDATLAGYVMKPPQPELIQVENDNSPHTRHGGSGAANKATAVAVQSQLL